MTASLSPFTSATALETAFADRLAAMLASHRGLGVYILVLANAAYDSALWAHLAPVLAARHSELADALTAALRQGRKLTEPDDDVLVFLKLHAIGFAHLQTLQSRRAGHWDLLFNPLRALRPTRTSGLKFQSLLCPFDPAGFHFNRPFLAREIFWQGDLAGKPARLLYNKFPFARLHGLLVPEPQRQLPQYLSPELHGWAWELCEEASVPGLCLGYNSVGAGASVNHLHFQSFVQPHPLPVQDPCFIHNGGKEPYPLPCQRFTDPAAAWVQLNQLHQHNTPYNLIYSQMCLHLIPRVAQDSPRLNAQNRGYGWSEMAGVVTLFSREAFEEMSAEAFEAELAGFPL
ncbi:MAG: hypothetical protein B7X81_04660 [Hydrogenophilales bacterium 17-61-76]|nr:MAG: hypothetical protein B7Y21_11580 [Hydrogenophilales bacterium 16-61-112]OZA47939.1 MAG: hypothetical protein B7X81_04660 [Hydrogenophilales bacterium 17-61-76]